MRRALAAGVGLVVILAVGIWWRVASGQREVLDVAPPPGAAINGVVTDASGRPISQAKVQGTFADQEHSAVTAADGSFELAPVAEGHGKLTVSHPDWPSYEGWVQAPASELRITLQAGNVLSGIVTEDGKPVAGAEVTVLPAALDDDSPPRLARSAQDGTFSLRGLAAGSYEISATFQEGERRRATPPSLLAVPRRDPVELRLAAVAPSSAGGATPQGPPERLRFWSTGDDAGTRALVR